MANERRLNKSASRTPRHGSSTTTTIAASASTSANSSGSGSGNSGSSTLNAISGGKKQSRQYRLPHPPVPHAQTSLLQSQRVPASVVAYPSARQAGYESPQVSDSRYYASGGRGGSQTTTSTAAGAESLAPTTVNATDGSTEAAVPSADPDSMEAKKGLNKWGAFDSLSGSGTGTFGFGPLLFHHVDETPRDPYDTTNMMLNDPISFNPMSAISWARLDESPDSIDELDGDQSSTAQKPDIVVAARAAAGTGGSRQDGGNSSHVGYVDSPASTAASPRHGSGASYASDVSGSRTSSVAGSSVGNISRTFSDTSLVSPDTERSSAGVPPAFTSPPSSRTPHPHPSQQQQRQGSQTEVPVQYQTHRSQQQAYPTQKPTPSRSPTSHRAPAGHQPYTSESYTHTRQQQHTQHSNRHRHQQQQQQQQQQTSQSRQPQQQLQQLQQAPAPPPSLPAHQATTDLLLCLGPHCSARFPTEQELAAHYRAEHAFTCTWASCSAPSFTSSNALAWHVNAEHYLVCPQPGCCGAMFPSKRALDGHLKVSRIDPTSIRWQLFRPRW